MADYRVCVLSGLGIAGIMIAHGASAQPSDAPSLDLAPACLSGTWQNVSQVPDETKGKAFSIVVPEADAGILEAQGFERIDCKVADLASKNRRMAWRDSICKLAAIPNDAYQNQFERAMGARPAALCASAELLEGGWKPRKEAD